MKLYLIRHGETVDNIAGLYAGVRDSALTVHGIEQARRLGDYFAKHNVKLTHIFASPLQRAYKTAEAVRDAEPQSSKEGEVAEERRLEIVQVRDLIEQDFGYYEGKSFFARSEAKKSGREIHHDEHKNDPGFVDVETKESMCKRADAFLDQHLIPLLLAQPPASDAEAEMTVVVVSHGMLLGNLWRRLLLRLPRKSLRIAAEVTAARGPVVLEHLGGWSNTGYLELLLERDEVEDDTAVPSERVADRALEEVLGESEPAASIPPRLPVDETSTSTLPTPIPPPAAAEAAAPSPRPHSSFKAPSTPTEALTLAGWSTTILAVDSKQHLVGFKRQRGGIGRIAHDEGQKKLDGFFKRQKKG